MTTITPTHPSTAPLLRPVRAEDAEAVRAAFATPDMERQGSVTDLASAHDWIEQATAPDRYVFALEAEGSMVGAVGVAPVDRANRVGWFWYWTHGDHRGRGLTSQAAATVAGWALTMAGLHRLELGHRRDNPASGAVALAAGFRQEGCEREKFEVAGARVDVLTYGRVLSDPEPATPPLPLHLPASGFDASF